uniref:Zinc finger MYM-type protein 1 n=2 Tax=Cacopsylla melanoneura TaxID=428564 RepID=A0A8D8RCD6_9HEMI
MVYQALVEIETLNLTAETRRDVEGLKKYIKSFNCLLMSSIWLKILKAIDIVNKILQSATTTVDIAVKNVRSLIETLKKMRSFQFECIFEETVTIANKIEWPETFIEDTKRGLKRKRMADESDDIEERVNAKDLFRRDTYNVKLDKVIQDITVRFESLEELTKLFSVLWLSHTYKDSLIEKNTELLIRSFPNDLDIEIVDELKNMKMVYSANFGGESGETIQPLELLNKLLEMKLNTHFPNIVLPLRIFLTIPATSAGAERAFSHLKQVKNVLRSTMCQNRLSSLGVLAVEHKLARKANLQKIIEDFASNKARRKITE